MKINMIKMPGGVLLPAYDLSEEQMTKFKTGEVYEVEIKMRRNIRFHRKAFALLNFCYDHWSEDKALEHLDKTAQFDVFRKHLTCLAGYYNSYVGINGSVRIEAKSISYGAMETGEFEQWYNAIVKAALKHIFHSVDVSVENRLMSFF